MANKLMEKLKNNLFVPGVKVLEYGCVCVKSICIKYVLILMIAETYFYISDNTCVLLIIIFTLKYTLI